jgi:hypothetical protein
MIGLFVMFVSGLVCLWLWLARIRSYVMRSGETPITAPTWGVSAWADWQQCWEHAKAHHDQLGLRLAHSFLFWQIAGVLGFVLLLCGI